MGKIDPHSWYCKCIYWDHNCVLKQSYYLNVARPYFKHVFKNKLLHISLINGLFFIICGCLSCLQSQCLHRAYQLQKFHFTARYISKRQNDKHQLNFMLVLIKRIPYHYQSFFFFFLFLTLCVQKIIEATVQVSQLNCCCLIFKAESALHWKLCGLASQGTYNIFLLVLMAAGAFLKVMASVLYPLLTTHPDARRHCLLLRKQT